MEKKVKLVGTSSYFPGEPIKFEEINNYIGNMDRMPQKTQKWVNKIQPIMKEMLGVEYCYYAFNNKTREFDDDCLTMAVKAARKALDEAGIDAKDIDLLVYGSNYSEQMPPLSARIQEELGIDICTEFQIHSNCTSIYKAIDIAHEYLKSGRYKNALVLSSCVTSSFFIPEFYNQEKVTKEDIFLRWYLCDGAGAFVMSAVDEREPGFYIENSYLESAGGHKKSAMGNHLPAHWSNPIKSYEQGLHHIKQVYVSEMKGEGHIDAEGKTVFFTGLKRMMEKEKLSANEITHFVVNMPSKSVREHIMDECKELGFTDSQVYSAVEKVGYAGPPAAIISVDQLLKEKKFKDGDMILSFVMEVSKFMQAGFTVKYYE